MARREQDLGPQGIGLRPPARVLIAVGAALGALVLYAAFVEPQRVALEEVEIALPGLPADLDHLRILQVSDLESRGRGRREDRVAALAASAGADVLVVTGDLVSKTLPREAWMRAVEDVADLLGAIPYRYGAWFVEGHGERYGPAGRRETVEALESRGLRFLADDVATVAIGRATLAVVGLELRGRGRQAVFYQRPDGTIVDNGGSRTEGYLNLVGEGSALLRDYEFTGEFRFSREDAGVGVTFYNMLPLREDRFYRIRRTETGGVLKLSPHGTVFSHGRSASGVSPSPGPWVAFRIRAEREGEANRVRARAWMADETEPSSWTIDCVDATPTRPPGGTVGIWTSGPGRKEFRHLAVVGMDGTVILEEGRATAGSGWSWAPPVAPDFLLALAAKIPQGAFALALSHTPDPFPYTAALGWPLLLAGHTQGGQVRLPFIGALSTDTALGRRYAAGLFDRGGSKLYITRGIGTSRVPFRFLSPPELTLITLRGAAAPGGGA